MSIGESHTKLWEHSGRVEQQEWLDLGYGSSAEVAASLAEMGRLNRYLGGLRALTVHLYPRLAALALQKDEITVLDLGTGGAEIPVVLAGWARRHKTRLHILGVDLAQRHLE